MKQKIKIENCKVTFEEGYIVIETPDPVAEQPLNYTDVFAAYEDEKVFVIDHTGLVGMVPWRSDLQHFYARREDAERASAVRKCFNIADWYNRGSEKKATYMILSNGNSLNVFLSSATKDYPIFHDRAAAQEALIAFRGIFEKALL